jgi:hypothetical protein
VAAEPLHYEEDSPELEGRTAHLTQNSKAFVINGLEPAWKLHLDHLASTIGVVLLLAAGIHVATILLFACLFSFEPSGLSYTPDLGLPGVMVPAGFMSRLSFAASSLLCSTRSEHVSITPLAFWTHTLWHLCSYTGHTLRILMTLRLFFALSKAPSSVFFSKWMVTTNKSLTGLHSLEFRIANKYGFERKLLQAQVSQFVTVVKLLLSQPVAVVTQPVTSFLSLSIFVVRCL